MKLTYSRKHCQAQLCSVESKTLKQQSSSYSSFCNRTDHAFISQYTSQICFPCKQGWFADELATPNRPTPLSTHSAPAYDPYDPHCPRIHSCGFTEWHVHTLPLQAFPCLTSPCAFPFLVLVQHVCIVVKGNLLSEVRSATHRYRFRS